MVATPIGNLEDITLRALRVLGEVEVIFCEDTRVTQNLLNKYKIENAKLESFHARSGQAKTNKILDILRSGKNCALVTDAGTPGISDPGSVLVDLIRLTLPEVKIVAVPGASALTAALSIAGVPTHEFMYYGFVPHKKGRQSLFKEIFYNALTLGRTSVIYESPHRIIKTLESLANGNSENDSSNGVDGGANHGENIKIVVVREITKIYEEVVRGNAVEVLEYFTKNSDKVRGEFVVIITR